MTTENLVWRKSAEAHKTPGKSDPKTRAIYVGIYLWSALATGLIHSNYQLKMCGERSLVASLAHAAMWPVAPVVYSMALAGSNDRKEIEVKKCKTYTDHPRPFDAERNLDH